MINIFRQAGPIAFLGALVAFVFAVMAHEVAHGYAAMRNGDNTAKYSGRMNFNPMNHFDLMGAMMFVIVGIGYAKPVPIDPRNFHNYKKGYFQVSIAGVLTNLVIALISAPLYYLAIKYLPDMLMFDEFIKYILMYSFVLNITLMLFNLIPIYPLDGFRLVELASRPNNKYVHFMRNNAQYTLLGFMAFMWLMPSALNPFYLLSNLIVGGLESFWGYIILGIPM